MMTNPRVTRALDAIMSLFYGGAIAIVVVMQWWSWWWLLLLVPALVWWPRTVTLLRLLGGLAMWVVAASSILLALRYLHSSLLMTLLWGWTSLSGWSRWYALGAAVTLVLLIARSLWACSWRDGAGIGFFLFGFCAFPVFCIYVFGAWWALLPWMLIEWWRGDAPAFGSGEGDPAASLPH
jgi:hypothetical protein